MERLTSWLCRPILCAAALLRWADRPWREPTAATGMTTAAVRSCGCAAAGAVGHIFVLELENEGEGGNRRATDEDMGNQPTGASRALPIHWAGSTAVTRR